MKFFTMIIILIVFGAAINSCKYTSTTNIPGIISYDNTEYAHLKFTLVRSYSLETRSYQYFETDAYFSLKEKAGGIVFLICWDELSSAFGSSAFTEIKELNGLCQHERKMRSVLLSYYKLDEISSANNIVKLELAIDSTRLLRKVSFTLEKTNDSPYTLEGIIKIYKNKGIMIENLDELSQFFDAYRIINLNENFYQSYFDAKIFKNKQVHSMVYLKNDFVKESKNSMSMIVCVKDLQKLGFDSLENATVRSILVTLPNNSNFLCNDTPNERDYAMIIIEKPSIIANSEERKAYMKYEDKNIELSIIHKDDEEKTYSNLIRIKFEAYLYAIYKHRLYFITAEKSNFSNTNDKIKENLLKFEKAVKKMYKTITETFHELKPILPMVNPEIILTRSKQTGEIISMLKQIEKKLIHYQSDYLAELLLNYLPMLESIF